MLFVSVLLAAAPLVSVAPSADEGLPCPVHQSFVAALAARNVVAPEAFTAVFERRERGWAFRLTRAQSTALTRELQVPCEEAGAVAALVVERYFAALFLAAPKVVAPTRPPRPTPPAAILPTPAVDAGAPEPIDAGVIEPLDAGVPELVDAGLEVTPEPIVDAGVPDVVVLVEPPPLPREPFLRVVPVVWLAAWWEVLPRVSPAVMVAAHLELGRVWRTSLSIASGLPLGQNVTVDETRTGTLVAWSSLGALSGGACARFERTTLCGDAVIGLRLTSGQSTGQLYQRQPALVVMPTAGLRGELVFRLTPLLSLSTTLLALVPWGRSTLQVEGTSSTYATPPVDLLAGLGLSFSL
ncbi:MAG: hypothetical protein Q8L14_42410 [Myxococcales bacterium]|nr:hypothetical protein [Myxococcales bacterium]